MIPVIRINAEDFIGTELESGIWDVIKRVKTENRQEFKLSFYVKEHGDIKTVLKSIEDHDDALQLKTTIKTEDKAKTEWVFLDVCSPESDDHGSSRFRYVAEPPGNIIGAFKFLEEHFEFVKKVQLNKDVQPKRQKRNDGNQYDRNNLYNK